MGPGIGETRIFETCKTLISTQAGFIRAQLRTVRQPLTPGD